MDLRRRTMCVALLASGWLLPAGVQAVAPWKRVTREQGVVLYQRELPDAQLPAFRAITVVPAPLERVAAVVGDVPGHVRWMHQTEVSRLLAEPAANVQVLYHRLDSPAPIRDRDVVLRAERRVIRPGEHIEMRFRAVSDPRAPDPGDTVRMDDLRGRIVLTRRSEGRTRVRYQVHADPGGTLPEWMAQRGMREMPLKTLVQLRKLVADHGRPPSAGE